MQAWRSGGKEEEALLYSCYKNSLELAVSKKCKSVAFPLISAGAYGCPKEKALSVAKKAISDFLETHELEVMLVLFDRTSVNIGGKLFSEIQSYIDSGDPMDKAGAYGIQGRGALLVKRIEGDYYNVMGLPVGRLYRELRKNR